MKRLVVLAALLAAATGAAAAQTPGTVTPRPLPPLANPNDPNLPAKELYALLHASVLRLDARGEPEDQLASVARELRAHGGFAAEKGYALAYATLLSGGVDEAERAFAERLRAALELEPRRAREIELDLETAARLR